MIEESGRVVAVEQGAVWVESIRQTACQSCAARNGCGQSALAKLGQQHKNHVRALNAFDLEVGDQVVIGVPEDVVLKGTLVAYLMPLVLMLVAAITADSFTSRDLWIALAGLSGLAVGFGLVRLHFLSVSRDKRYQPVVLRASRQDAVAFCPKESL
ncbi:MAG: SoxR reducing system RseC family protein [Ketobacteraceae bacterium]|nr:SoxR reducing system RseC family protein [Ketobacteraceae bacterium]